MCRGCCVGKPCPWKQAVVKAVGRLHSAVRKTPSPSVKSKTDGCLDAGDWLSSGCREQREGHQRQKGMFSEPSVDWDLGFIP